MDRESQIARLLKQMWAKNTEDHLNAREFVYTQKCPFQIQTHRKVVTYTQSSKLYNFQDPLNLGNLHFPIGVNARDNSVKCLPDLHNNKEMVLFNLQNGTCTFKAQQANKQIEGMIELWIHSKHIKCTIVHTMRS